jgi:hypothetical protein
MARVVIRILLELLIQVTLYLSAKCADRTKRPERKFQPELATSCV